MKKLKIGVLLFDQFELLDVFGPLEMFGLCSEIFEISLVGQEGEAIKSAQGPCSVLNYRFDSCPLFDILLVPGGRGTRNAVTNSVALDWLIKQSTNAKWTTSVCTGSALLAAAGLLEGRRATSNKNALEWVSTFGKTINWLGKARWVKDGNFYTSSGVSAGMDMALALIAEILGLERAQEVAGWAEYSWNSDSEHDPFAV